MLSVAGLVHHYGERRVLDGVSFEVDAGEVVAVIGPSGAGKTTLFRSVTGLVDPDGGRVCIGGRELGALSGAELRAVRREMGVIFQQFNLVRRHSAVDNVLVGRLAGVPLWRVALRRFPAADVEIALDCLDRVGLGDFADAGADLLSGGQQQRVAIARALAQQSTLLLADEPVASLDPASTRTVLATLGRIAHEDGLAVVCSLHQIDLVAGFADRVVGLRDGRVLFDVSAPQLSPRHQALVYDG